MSALVAVARQEAPASCHSRQCRARGCSLSLAGLAGDRLLINMDCQDLGIPADRPRCDFLFIGRETCVVPIELKRGKLEAGDVAAQLQTGATFADQLLAPSHIRQIHFRPLVAYGGKMHRSQHERLKAGRILFRHKQYEIKPVKCGSKLAQALP